MTNKEVIKKQVELLRNGYNIDVYPNVVEKLCNECDSENLKFTIVNRLGYEQINLNHLGIKEPFHRASLIGFNTKDFPEWFIVDPTYGQFFESIKFKNYMFKYYQKFATILLKDGFIENNISNILAYINGFIYSRAFTKSINEEEVYNNLQELLLSNSIVTKELYIHQKTLPELMKDKNKQINKKVKIKNYFSK